MLLVCQLILRWHDHNVIQNNYGRSFIIKRWSKEFVYCDTIMWYILMLGYEPVKIVVIHSETEAVVCPFKERIFWYQKRNAIWNRLCEKTYDEKETRRYKKIYKRCIQWYYILSNIEGNKKWRRYFVILFKTYLLIPELNKACTEGITLL